MQADVDAATEHLERILAADESSARIQAAARGVDIALPDQGLTFRHSFLDGPIARRARQPGQLLLKACNNRQRSIGKVLDLTAGWATDAFILASHGQEVTLLEHHDLVHAIVAHALAQLQHQSGSAEIAQRLHLVKDDALSYLDKLGPEHDFDCIYLDPMFPEHKSGAKPAKEMQILQALTDNANTEACFDMALAKAHKRVVVKRGARAPALMDRAPDFSQRAKTIRFDVYLTS